MEEKSKRVKIHDFLCFTFSSNNTSLKKFTMTFKIICNPLQHDIERRLIKTLISEINSIIYVVI